MHLSLARNKIRTVWWEALWAPSPLKSGPGRVCVCTEWAWRVFVLVRQLLQQGTSPDASNDDGLTALHQVGSSHQFHLIHFTPPVVYRFR